MSAIENGMTNVCGVAPENMLRAELQAGRTVRGPAGLRRTGGAAAANRRVAYHRAADISRRASGPAEEGVYPAGDALGFVDPFTGSGILGALITGALAGPAAARGLPVREYLRSCTRMLAAQYRAAGLFRAALRTRLAEALAPLVPGALLFRLTRPRCCSTLRGLAWAIRLRVRCVRGHKRPSEKFAREAGWG